MFLVNAECLLPGDDLDDSRFGRVADKELVAETSVYLLIEVPRYSGHIDDGGVLPSFAFIVVRRPVSQVGGDHQFTDIHGAKSH